MENACALPTAQVLAAFRVDPHDGLTSSQVADARKKYGSNCAFRPFHSSSARLLYAFATDINAAIPEDPPTPMWKLVLEQFQDQLVIILLGSAVISFVLAIFEDEGGWSAFVDPGVVGGFGSAQRFSASGSNEDS